MAVRLHSPQTRRVLAMVSVIVVTLALNGVYLIERQRSEVRNRIAQEAFNFAELTNASICTAYNDFYDSGFYKFRELIKERMRLNRDIQRILIVNMKGEILFDSNEMKEELASAPPAASTVAMETETDRLEAIKKLEPTVLKTQWADGEPGLEIIAPYLEEWGRHELSVIYQVTYGRTLQPAIRRLILTTGGLTLVSVLAAVCVAVPLLRRVA